MSNDKVGAVLVMGGGIAGMQASLDLADSGFKVYLLEKKPSIGGKMVQLDKTFPTGDCAMCTIAPKLVGTGRHHNIEIISNADLQKVEGEAGHFKVAITKRPRYINEDKCTGCGVCAQKCPVEAIDEEFNEGIGVRNASFVMYPQAVPLVYSIDRAKCIGCGTCEGQCKAGAIDYEQKEEDIEIEVGSIVLATGFDRFDPRVKEEYGYGVYSNVITSLEFERFLSASGPFTGMLVRPSDGEIPRKIAIIQCVGSRDEKVGNPYCSAVCCMYATKQAIIVKEHHSGISCHIFFMDIRAYGKEFEDYYNRAKEEYGVRYTRSRVSEIHEVPETKNLIVRYVNEDEEMKDEEFDLVVLSVGLEPPSGAAELAEKLGIELNEYGFCATKTFSPLNTTRPGIFVGGTFSGPKDIPDSVAQASGATSKASGIIASERGKLITELEYPPERDVEGEEPRIGVFICHCGVNIGGVVNVPEVTEYAKTLPNVVHAENNVYTCSDDTQKRITEKINELKLNRVIVASCTPRTHEPLFRSTVRAGGLNPYLFEMANIRDQCSWVHTHKKEKATEKAKDLVRIAVGKARLLKPLHAAPLNVTQSGLVIGGGLAGLTVALELAKQGVEIHLVEKEKELGGRLRRTYYTLDDEDPQKYLRTLIKKVNLNQKIHVYTNADIVTLEGFVGNFRSTIAQNGTETRVEHGTVIVATGAQEYKPDSYLYGTDSRVITQIELEEKLAKDGIDPKTVVMIQCVGSRGEKVPYCSRSCCTDAIKNALKIKERKPNAKIYMLFKDMMTYSFKEDYYKKAGEQEVVFIRYDDDNKPKVTNENGALKVSVKDRLLKTELLIEPDLLVLTTATLPNPDNVKLSQLLKVPLSKDGFFQEAHVKLRPVDFASEGVFLCGLAHSPKSMDEIISQACGAASRAMTLLSKEVLETEAITAQIDLELCIGCGRCEEVCEYKAIKVSEVEKGIFKAEVNEGICKGCGSCAVACATGAIIARHFTDRQIITMIDTLFEGVKTKIDEKA